MIDHLEIRYSPVYEFLLSQKAYIDKGLHKVLDLGPAWVKQVAAALPEGFAELALAAEKAGFPDGLCWQCPDPETPEALLEWLSGISVGELYERILAQGADPARLPPDLGALRDRLVQVLSIWHRCYYRHLDPRIPEGLARAAAHARAVAADLSPEAAVEQITGGIVVEEIAHVTLIPQYHCSPLNMFDTSSGRCVIGYPAEAVPAAPGAIPPDLRNIARALADDSRLHILRFLASGIRSFTDVVKLTGLAKSTVHHHLVILRHSGLVRVHFRPEATDRFSLRPEGIDQISPRLRAFLKEE